jgi:hypothetical protein
MPPLCRYHAVVYATKRERIRTLHEGTLRDLEGEAACVARQCPQCVARAKEGA